MRLPANLTTAHKISTPQKRHPALLIFEYIFLSLSYKAKDTQPAAEHMFDT